jgi:hypothetical protein
MRDEIFPKRHGMQTGKQTGKQIGTQAMRQDVGPSVPTQQSHSWSRHWSVRAETWHVNRARGKKAQAMPGLAQASHSRKDLAVKRDAVLALRGLPDHLARRAVVHLHVAARRDAGPRAMHDAALFSQNGLFHSHLEGGGKQRKVCCTKMHCQGWRSVDLAGWGMLV